MANKGKLKTIDFFAANPVFSLIEATQKLGAPRGRIGTVDRLKHYLRNGRLLLVTRGIYAVIPPGVAAKKFQPDPFLVGAAVRSDAIFSYHSALELLGLSHSAWNRHSLFSAHSRSSLSMMKCTLSILRDPGPLAHPRHRCLGTRKVQVRGQLLTVTGSERTLVESLRRPDHCGGIEELVKSIEACPVLDLELLRQILQQYDTANLWAATGWFLEQFKTKFSVPDSLLLDMQKRCPQSPQYLDKGRRGGRLYSNWNMIIPEAIAKGGIRNEA